MIKRLKFQYQTDKIVLTKGFSEEEKRNTILKNY